MFEHIGISLNCRLVRDLNEKSYCLLLRFAPKATAASGKSNSVTTVQTFETPLLHGHFNMSASHLGNTPLDIAKLRDVIRKRLPELLDTVRASRPYLFVHFGAG